MIEETKEITEDTIFKEIDIVTPEHKKHISNAKTALYVVAGLIVLGGVFSSINASSNETINIWIEVLIVAGIFVILALLAQKWTFQSLLVGLIIYLLYQLLYFVNYPETIIKGIIIKIAIVIYLGKGLVYANDLRKSKKILNQ